MTATYRQGETFLGEPITRVRNLLRSWRLSDSVHESAVLKTVGLDARAAAVIMDELEIRGMLGYTRKTTYSILDLTEAGMGLAGATAMRPIARKMATSIVDQVFDRCVSINDRTDIPFLVRKIWLFGSYARGAAKVNDIDMVIETEDLPDEDFSDERWRELASDMGGENTVRRSLCPEAAARSYVKHKLMFGNRRHPRISSTSLRTLQDLACECRLAFDHSRGGRVDDAVLPHHPGSRGRGMNVKERRHMPDLDGPSCLIPVSIEHVDMAFATIVDEKGPALELRRYPSLHSIDIIHDRPGRPRPAKQAIRTWLEGIGALDGRSRVILSWSDPEAPGPESDQHCILVERRMEKQGNGFTYSIDIANSVDTSMTANDSAIELAARLVATAGADVERIVRHHRDTGNTERVPIDIRIDRSDRTPAGRTITENLQHAIRLPEQAWMSDYAKHAATIRVSADPSDANTMRDSDYDACQDSSAHR